MKTPFETTKKDAQIAMMTERVSTLEKQLDWFKGQLFCRKSERVLPAGLQQNSLFDTPVSDETAPPPKAVKAHTHLSKKLLSDTDEEGLRFDDTSPRQPNVTGLMVDKAL